MRVIAAIEAPDVIRKILKHLDLWEVRARPPPKTRVYPPWQDFPTEAPMISDAQQMPSVDDPSTPVKLRRDKLPD